MDRITELLIFQRVAQLGGFSRAADSLGISRATVTRSIRKLESNIGVRLLNRTTRAVSLSAAGNDFLVEVNDLLERCESLFNQFHSDNVPLTGTLRIAASTAFSEFFIAKALEDFQRENPDLRFELITQLDNYSAGSLIVNRVDLACCVSDVVPENVVAIRLGTTESVVCATQDVLRNWGMPSRPEELPEQALIPGGYPAEWVLSKGSQRVVLIPRGPVTLPDAHLALRSALRSSGFALLPHVAVKKDLSEGSLHRVLNDWHAQTLPIFALLPSRIGADRRLSRLIDFLRVRLDENAAM